LSEASSAFKLWSAVVNGNNVVSIGFEIRCNFELSNNLNPETNCAQSLQKYEATILGNVLIVVWMPIEFD
jgi:hypothetical protein